MTDDTFEPEGNGVAPPGTPEDDARPPAPTEAQPAFGQSAGGAVWQEGTPGHWVIKLTGLPGAPAGQEATLGRPDASNHSPFLAERAEAPGRIAGLSVAWIESPAGDPSGVGRVMWQSFAAAPAGPPVPEAAANDNARWVTDRTGAGVFGSEPGIAALATGETVVTWIGMDGHAHGRLYAAADADGAARAGDGSDAPEHAAVNASLGDLGPVAAVAEGGRRLQVAELRPGAFAVMWLALADSGPVLRGGLFLAPAGAEAGDDPAWTEHPVSDIRLPPGATGPFALLPAGDKGGLQVALPGPAGPVTVNVLDHAGAALVAERLAELAPEDLPDLAALPAEADAAAAAPAAAVRSHLPPQADQGETPPTLHEDHGKPAKTALAVATTPGVTETAPIVVPVQQGFAVAWQAPAGTDNGVQIKLTLFSQDGAPKSPQILIADNAAADVAPAIAGLRDGVAAAYVQADHQTLVVKAYAGDGAQVGEEAVVDPGDSNAVTDIAIASTDDDAFAVVYVQQHPESGGDAGDYGNIMLQRFAVAEKDGHAQILPLGHDGTHDGHDAPAQVAVDGGDAAAPAPAVGRAPAVAGVDDGELAIVWVESDGTRETIKGCVLDEGGGQMLLIDLTGLLGSAGIAKGTTPALLDAGDGDFLVTWLQPDGDGGGYVVMSALYDEVSPGVWLVPEEAIRLKDFDSEPKDYSVVVSSGDDGSFIDVLWRQDSSGPGGGDKVLSQRYDLDGHRLGAATRLAGDDALDVAPAGDTLAAAGLSDGQIVVVYAEQGADGDLDLAAHIIDTSAPEETAGGDGEADQAADDAAGTTFSTGVDQETAINPLASGIEAGLAVAEINGVPISTAAPVDVGSGWVQLREDGWLTVAPDAGYTGPIAFEYTVAGAADGAPSKGHVVVNVEPAEEPATVSLHNQLTAVPEDLTAGADLKVADIAVADGQLGTDGLSLTGLDADMFKIVGNALYLKGGIELDFETKPTLSVEIAATHGDGSEGAARFTLSVESAGEALGDTFVFAPGYGDTGAALEAADHGGTGYATFQDLLASGALVEAADDVVVAPDPGAPADPSKIAPTAVSPSALGDPDFKFS